MTKKWIVLWLLFVGVAGCTAVPDASPAANENGENGTANLPAGFDVEGHRGTRGLKPENTLPAFETALDLGVTTLELDLHFTKDGEVVVWHDPVLPPEKCVLAPDAAATFGPDDFFQSDDPADQYKGEYMISRMTLNQLRPYLCNQNPDTERYPDQNNDPTPLAGDNYHIITLQELFDFVQAYSQSPEKTAEQRANAAQVHFNIETKRKPDNPETIGDAFDGQNPGAFELKILEIVEAYGLTDRVIIQSFDHRSLWAVHSANPDIQLAALTSRTRPNFDELAQNGAAIWSPNVKDLTPRLLAQAHEAGLRVIPWTVNDADDMRELIEMGVDGLITDRPDVLMGLEN